jgi:hypothetical protein
MMLISESGESASGEHDHAMFERIGQWWGELTEKGTIVEGHQLQPAHTATTVNVDGNGGAVADGPAFVTDGPFSEAKETVGGYGVLDVADLDEALRVARSWPGHSRLELRPVVEREGM